MQGITSKRILAIAAKYSIMPEAIDEMLAVLNSGTFLVAVDDGKLLIVDSFHSIEAAAEKCEEVVADGYPGAIVLRAEGTCKEAHMRTKEWVNE